MLQVTAILGDQFAWAGWVQRSITVVLGVGLLVVVVLAWYHGEQGRQRVTGPELLILASLLAVGGLLLALIGPATDGAPAADGGRLAGAAPANGSDSATPASLTSDVPASELDPRKVAVLPFHTLSEDEEGAAFALGVHDDILTRLSKIRDLRVISRTSVMEYEDTPKNVREIASELGAGAVIEGGVQRAGGQVRLNVQLIDARTDEHLWAETYDREWSLSNLFAIQTEIAERVATALQATLSDSERARVGDRPTDDPEAYELFQRARRRFTEPNETSIRLAIEELRRATELDPAFAESFALLGYHHAAMYWFHFDRTAPRLAAAKAAIDSALALESDLAGGHVAMGYYWYWGHLAYDRALAQFAIAEEIVPHDTDLLIGIASVRRRQGRMPEAVEYFERAVEVAPRNPDSHRNLGETLFLLNRFDQAELHLRENLRLSSESPNSYVVLAQNYLARGRLDDAREVLDQAESLRIAAPEFTVPRIRLESYEGRPRAALKTLEQASEGTVRDDQFRYEPVELVAARLHQQLGEADRAREFFEAAAERLEREIDSHPDDVRRHGALGMALAGLGREAEAIDRGQRALEMLPPETEAWRGTYRLDELARIRAMLGQAGPATELLERLLSMPSDLKPPMLRLDPVWDPIRDDPRFRALAVQES